MEMVTEEKASTRTKPTLIKYIYSYCSNLMDRMYKKKKKKEMPMG